MDNQTDFTAPGLPGFNQLRQCRDGLMLYNRNDVYVGRSLERYGEYSQGEVDAFRQILQPGDVVIDVGANIGALTVPLARIVGDTGVVIAFEPQPFVFHTLCANIALNSLTNVRCSDAAVGSEPGEILVPVLDPKCENNFGGLTIGGGAGAPVRLTTLDASVHAGRCALIKVDVEGMEADVLIGGSGLIMKHRPVLYVENIVSRDEALSDALIRLIRAFDYRLYWHRPALFNPDNFAGETENIFENIASHNMLCFPAESGVDVDGLQEVSA